MNYSLRKFCAIPGCKRSAKDDGSAAMIICGKHWRSIPIATRDEQKASKKALRLASTALARGKWIERFPTYAAARRTFCALSCADLCAWLAVIREATLADRMGLVANNRMKRG